MQPTRRILISSMLGPHGGIETHVYYLAKHLRSLGASVTLACQSYKLNPEWDADLRSSSVRIISTPLSGAMRFRLLPNLWAAAAFHLRLRRDYDVLLCIYPSGFHRVLLPFVRPGGWTIYNHVMSEQELRSKHLSALRAMRGVLTLAPRASATLHNEFGIRQPTRAMPLLIGPADEAPEATPRPLGGGQGPLRIAYFGRLHPIKRPDLLVRLWRLLDIGEARLEIYGDGPLFGPIAAYVEDQELSGSVNLHGAYAHKEVGRLMRDVDLVVLPSSSEGLGLVLLEAMANGVPFVASGGGGVPDLALENPDAIVCGEDPEELRTGIESMVALLRQGEISSRRLQDYYRARFSYAAVAEGWRRALMDSDAFFGSELALDRWAHLPSSAPAP